MEYLVQYYENIHKARMGDLVLGVSCIVFLLVVRVSVLIIERF